MLWMFFSYRVVKKWAESLKSKSENESTTIPNTAEMVEKSHSDAEDTNTDSSVLKEVAMETEPVKEESVETRKVQTLPVAVGTEVENCDNAALKEISVATTSCAIDSGSNTEKPNNDFQPTLQCSSKEAKIKEEITHGECDWYA